MTAGKAPKKKAGKKKAEGKGKKKRLTPEQKENPNLLLVENKKVKILEKDPFLEGKYDYLLFLHKAQKMNVGFTCDINIISVCISVHKLMHIN